MKSLQQMILLLLCAFSHNIWAFQSCEIPLIIELDNATSSSIDLEWIDFNDNSLNFDFEIIADDQNQTGIASITGITGSTFTLTGLEPATPYELYIRAQCPDGESEWNGPFNFKTNLTATSNCDLNFILSDDQCPATDAFFFENELPGVLGENLFIESVEIAIEHNWPPDLKLQLVSPAGVKVDLISNLGINSQNLGDPSMPCQQSLVFSDRACEYIRDASFPINGLYEPEVPLEIFYDGSEGLGNWSLEICDRADGDIGVLKQFNINFSQGACYPPGEISLAKIGGNFISLEWNSPSCDELEVIYGIEPFDPGTASVAYVDCNDQFFRINNLVEDTDYVFFINTICSQLTFENECPIYLHTECANPSLDLNFDNLELCEESCAEFCDLDNDFWFNATNDDVDWLVNSGRTPTSFTGPEGDLKGNGNYVYVDAASSTCGEFLFASLESECINITSNASACDLSFYYYMFGVDVGKIGLDISLNNGQDWTNLWSVVGDQGRQWRQTVIDLSDYDGQIGIFRIFAETIGGNFGDIAVDEIKLYSSLLTQSLDVFYEDLDGDGYGNADKPFQFCAITTPVGFSDNNEDCNDDNPLINPSINESPCNLIDDNCDGQVDELNSNPLDYLGSEVMEASCSGNKDAIIEVSVAGGIPPYEYLWSDGETSNPNINVNPGIFQCTITDQGGCVLISDFIVVEAEKELIFNVINIKNSECENGSPEGAVGISIEGGTEPYQFGWSNGATVQNPILLESGEYVVSITDANNCSFISDPIFVDNNVDINSEVLINKSTSCFDSSDGELFVSATGGEAPYTYEWSNNQTGNQVQNLETGFYNYTVTDANDCSFVVDSIFIDSPEQLDIRVDAIESNLCNTENEGIILTTPIGGTAPYTFFWSNGENTDDLKSLENGSYNLTVNDSNGCTAEFSNIIIQSPEDIEIEIELLTNETCRSGQNGYISVQSTGGSGAYNYNWSNGVTNLHYISDLESGIYAVTVIDEFGCKKSLNNIEILEENTDLPVNIEELQGIDCFGDDDASLSANVSSGTFPYDFNWSNGTQNIGDFSTNMIDNLPAGSFNLTVTDGLGCTGISESIVIDEPDAILYVASTTDPDCFELGSISLDIMGGNSPYIVNWETGQQGAMLNGLTAGNYLATITDQSNCNIVTNEISLQEFQNTDYTIDHTDATSSTLGDIEVVIGGGEGPYLIQVNFGQLISEEEFASQSFPAGEYSIQAFDATGCQIFSEIITIQIIDSTSEIDFAKNYKLYPNPSYGSFYLEGINLPTSEMKIMNMQGKEVDYSLEYHSGMVQFNLEHSQAGVYLLMIQEGSQSSVKKLIITPH